MFLVASVLMNLKDNLTKFQAKVDEGIFLGYSQNSVAYRVLNKRTRKVEETFNLTFDDYYLKQTDSKFENKSILVDSDTQIDNSKINDFDYDLIFGIPDRAIDAENNAPDNQSSESSKHTDDSTITTSSVYCESVPEVRMEGEHTITNV